MTNTHTHQCHTPSSGVPGDTWTCGDCRQQWWADEPDYSGVDSLFIEWRSEEA